MKEGLGGGKERMSRINEYSLLQSVYRERKNSPQRESPQNTGIAKEREVERRYLPARLLSEKEILSLPGAYARRIAQRYVWAETEKGKIVRFRLRKTDIVHGNDKNTHESLYRIAFKRKSKKNSNARFEVQKAIPARDPKARDEQQEFLELWEKGVNAGVMTRFYIPHTFTRLVLEDGKRVEKKCTCEIHYEVRHEPPDVKGFVRIEVEFESDEDEAYAHDNQSALPDWIGEDVTDNRLYKSASLQAYGLPSKAKTLMAKLAKKAGQKP